MSIFSDQTSTTMSGPAPWLEPYLQSYVGNAARLASQPQPMYMGPRVAPWNQNYTNAIDLTRQTAMNSSPDVLAGRGAVTNIAGGAYQNNPWLANDYTGAVIGDTARQMTDAFGRGTQAGTNAMFSRDNAFGGSAWQETNAANAGQLAQQVGAMANQYRLGTQQQGAGDYRSGVNQQLGAAGMAPAMQGMDLQAGQALAGAGDMQRNFQQQLMDTNYNTWLGQQSYPYQQAQFFGGALGIPGGGTSTTTSPGMSPLGAGLGALAIGASLWPR
jgi:hypothetical protein